jgi:uncharacterized protein (TIGR02246 family)
MRNALLIPLLLGAATLSGARDNPTDQTRARQEIRSLLGRLANAEKAGDAALLAQCYESDAWFLPSSGEPVRGREDIARRYQAIFTGNSARLPLESEELWVMDDWAVSRGATRGPGPRQNTRGPVRNRYVMTLKRHGDAWEIHSLVWNSGAPAK